MKAKRRRRLRPLLFVIPVVAGALSGLTCDALTMARERARRARCSANLKCGIGYVSHLFAGDHGEQFPPTLGVLYPDYMSDGSVWLCPSAGKATALEDDPHFSRDDYTPAMLGDTHADYVWVSGLTADDPASYVLAFEDEWNHEGAGANVLFIGSNVEWIRDFKRLHEQLARQEKELAAQGRKMKVLRPAWSSWPERPPGLTGRPWYERRGGRALAVGVIAAPVIALPLIIRTVKRRPERKAEES